MTNFSLSFPTAENILSEEFLSKYRGKQPEWGFNGLGYIVYKRTYARLKEDGLTEEWNETVERCIRGAQKIGAGYTVEEAERLYDHMFNLRGNMAGRFLWQLGTITVDKLGLPSLCNCWFVTMHEAESFCFLFEHLMLGGGVGFSVQKEHIYQLSKVKKFSKSILHEKTKDADFIVPDSREGWVELLRKILHSYFVSGKGFTYSTILVRGADEPIKGFGGTASGPQILIDGMNNILNIFNSRGGKRLRSIDVLDICNILGSIVVAGNVRRSAELAIGDADDKLYLQAKNWSKGNIPNWRAMSNNSINADGYNYLSNDFWSGYSGDGEPYGITNIRLTQKYGRLIDGPMKHSGLYPFKEDPAVGFNPCVEANLESGEPCDLAELYQNRLNSKEEMLDCAILLYKAQKAALTLPSIYPITETIVRKNMRIGLGVTGICNDISKRDWLDWVYVELRKFDKEWSKQRGWAESIKMTVIKPSGTLSLLAGSFPGGHPGYSDYFIRRVRMSSKDRLVEVCRNLGCPIEYQINFDGTTDYATSIVSFPCTAGENALVADNVSAVDQLEMMKYLQTYWADQSVSITVYYKKEELPVIKQWLEENYETSVKAVSFLLHSEHGFKQAPYEKISKNEYEKMCKHMKPISSMHADVGDQLLDSSECVNGACPVR